MAPYFEFTGQGTIEAKNKAPMNMYFLDRLKEEYSDDANGRTANTKLLAMNNPLNIPVGD
jgi:adenylate cyclase